MSIKFENRTSRKQLPGKTEASITRILETLPREHLRGIDKIRFVDSITDPRLRNSKTTIPGLYHPQQGSQKAWLEVALDVLVPREAPFHKKILPRLSYKSSLAAVIFSLVGQHHYLTLRHSIKKNQLETAIRAYTEGNLKKWGAAEHTIRARLFRPFQPTLEKWARSLQRRAKKAKAKENSR